jgi:hypothetical protein
MASTMACPNFKKGLKMVSGPLGVNNGFNNDLKVSSLYKTGHNKYKEFLSTKFQFKLDKNPTWPRSWMLLDPLFHYREGCASLSLKNVMEGLAPIVENLTRLTTFCQKKKRKEKRPWSAGVVMWTLSYLQLINIINEP